MNKLSLGEKLSILRTRKGLSKKSLSNITGIHWITIGKYERNKVTPSIEAVVKLAEALDASTDYLLLDKEPVDIADKELVTLTEKIDHLPEGEKNKLKNMIKSYVGE